MYVSSFLISPPKRVLIFPTYLGSIACGSYPTGEVLITLQNSVREEQGLGGPGAGDALRMVLEMPTLCKNDTAVRTSLKFCVLWVNLLAILQQSPARLFSGPKDESKSEVFLDGLYKGSVHTLSCLRYSKAWSLYW